MKFVAHCHGIFTSCSVTDIPNKENIVFTDGTGLKGLQKVHVSRFKKFRGKCDFGMILTDGQL